MKTTSTTQRRHGLVRLLALALMVVLLVPLFMSAFMSPASAEKDPADYSLYALASNASAYFGESNSPQDEDKKIHDDWLPVTQNPAMGGSMLGYADADISVFNVIGWLSAEISGSTQTDRYDTFSGEKYSGLLDYAHFGAANRDLGLDTMSSGIGGELISMIGGSIMWLLYATSIAVSTLFWLIIELLKLINPFLWFYQAINAVNPTFAEGMVQGNSAPGALAGLQQFTSEWYGLINDIAWGALVPLFMGFLMIGLVLFKKMRDDRGSAIKKFVVRVVFIGVGIPLIGSMYTSTLNKFSDSIMGQHAGPTRVVLSTYVDFERWMMNDRLGIPDQASIGWKDGQASPASLMAVRTTALAINSQSNPAFSGISIRTGAGDAESAWKDGNTGITDTEGADVTAVFSTFGMLNDYIGSRQVAASDFESGIKTSIGKLENPKAAAWFVNEDTYGDVEEFGEGHAPKPSAHPVIATNGQGLKASTSDGVKTFSTTGPKKGCGFKVVETDTENPASCNLAPLAAYNYLNTGFSPTALTKFSSNNATSGFTRENHMSVSQVGTGPAKFMYWVNAVIILGCISAIGLVYAIGMLIGSVKRMFGLVAAIPFATLGALQAIAKVVVYSAALILEIIVTLFMYRFVSEFLISIPSIMSGPVSQMMKKGTLLGDSALGGIVVVILTLVSSLMILGVTMGLLKARKQVLQAMDEAFTKMVDKFLDTNSAPSPDKGSLMPAMAQGAAHGAGAAAGQQMSSALGKPGGGAPSNGGDKPGDSTATNAGGMRSEQEALSGSQALALEGGQGGSPGDGPNGGSDSGSGGPGDQGGPLQLPGGSAGSSRAAKDAAQEVTSRGGLSDLGYDTGSGQSSSSVGASGQPSSGGTTFGTDGSSGGGSSSPRFGAEGPASTGGPAPTGGGNAGSGSRESAPNRFTQSGAPSQGSSPNGAPGPSAPAPSAQQPIVPTRIIQPQRTTPPTQPAPTPQRPVVVPSTVVPLGEQQVRRPPRSQTPSAPRRRRPNSPNGRN